MTTEERIERVYLEYINYLDSLSIAQDITTELWDMAREAGMPEPTHVWLNEWEPRGITLGWADLGLFITPVREDGALIYYWERGMKQGWWTEREIRERLKEWRT